MALDLRGRISRSVGTLFGKSYSLPSTGGGASLGNLLGGGGNGDIPYAGAWQQNVRDAQSAGPHMFANTGIFSCMNVISSDISVIPPEVLITDANGIRNVHTNHPYTALLQNPNSFQTQLQFVQEYMLSKLRAGNTYVLMLRDARYVVNEMFVLNPNCVQPLITDTGDVFYRLSRDPLANLSDSVVVPARDIVHDRNMALWHPLVGMSPLFAACMNAMIMGRIQMNSEHFFRNMARTSGVLVAPGKVEPAVAKKLQADWESNYSGGGIGRTAVLTNGFDYKPMSPQTAVESEMVNQLRWGIEEISRVFGVPAYRIGEMNKATYRNSEQQARDYVKNCIGYHIRCFEQSVGRGLGLANGVEIRFNLTELFRMEQDVRYAAHKLALDAGFKTINEVRYEEDLPPVPGGDKPRVQMQSVPLEIADALANAQIAEKLTPPPAPKPAAPAPDKPAPKQLEFDLDTPDPAQMDLLVDAFVERFELGDENGA